MNYTSFYFLLSLSVLSIQVMGSERDKTHLLAKPFNHAHYQAYVAMIDSQGKLDNGQNGKVIPVPAAGGFDQEDEVIYANMILVENLRALQNTKQVPAQLSLLLQRFALLSAAPGNNSEVANRFEGMLGYVVEKATELKAEQQLSQLKAQLQEEKKRVNTWQDAAQTWKAVHEDAVRNLAQTRDAKEKLETACAASKQENDGLRKQLSLTEEQLTDSGYALYLRYSQTKGLQAENDFIRAYLERAQEEAHQAQEEAQQAREEAKALAKKNRNLQRRLAALQKATTKKIG